MRLLEALKLTGDKELKFFVWSEAVLTIIGNSDVSLGVTDGHTGNEILDKIDTLSRELQLDILTQEIPEEVETGPNEKPEEIEEVPTRRKKINDCLQSLLGVGTLFILLVVVFVTLNTFKMTGEEGSSIIETIVSFVMRFAKLAALGFG